MKKSKLSLILELVMLVVSIVLIIGAETFFRACGIHDDGNYGSCHWAQQAVLAAGMILMLQFLILLIVQERKANAAVSLCAACTSVVTALIPNVFISLCMMPSMRCNAVMRPWVIGLCAVLAVLGIVNLCLNLRKS